MKAAIYCRVSTEGQSYQQQVEPCIQMCKLKGWEYDIHSEVESSVKYRPVFEEVKKRARFGEYKAIVVWALDRAWRDSRMFIMDFDDLNARGVKIVSVMEGIDPTTTMGEFIAKVFIALAELERKLISERTKERLTALRNLGVTLGRPKGSKDKGKRKKSGYYNRWAEVNKGR